MDFQIFEPVLSLQMISKRSPETLYWAAVVEGLLFFSKIKVCR